jgi:hypothetical protein
MSSPRLEEFLARLYTDEPDLAAFLRSPAETAHAAGLDHAEVSALAGADHIGLAMAAASFRAKRVQRRSRRPLIRTCLALLAACRRRTASSTSTGADRPAYRETA